LRQGWAIKNLSTLATSILPHTKRSRLSTIYLSIKKKKEEGKVSIVIAIIRVSYPQLELSIREDWLG
jgi:hypothetical protein